jgi:Zn-dependent M28 family amino/carboxypeptidase
MNFRVLTTAALTTALCLPAVALSQSPAAFSGQRMSRDVQTLASDAYQGRAPATAGETKTIAYLIAQLRAAGVQPGGDLKRGRRQWTQAVPLLKSDINGMPMLSLTMNGTAAPLTQGSEIAVRAPMNGARSVNLANAPLVFVGYGVTAPERGWDDYKNADVRGKIAVMLINDPDFDGPAAADFGGKAMTYYGRWTYKYEEAARHGAAGVMIVHETAPASYGWNTVKNSNTNTMFDIVRADPAGVHTGFESWIQRALAERLFGGAAAFDAAKAAARQKDFRPIALKATLDARYAATVATITSYNVVGLLPGTRFPNETVIYSAHWDHLGVGQPDARGDRIYNGAVDNATGVAQVIEQARVFAREPRTPRSLVFLLVTAEEKGLLGSQYYAANPLYPVGRTVGVLNTDSMGIAGKAHNFSMSGNAKFGLLDLVTAEAARRGKVFTPDAHPEAGHFFRSDHFPFAKVGVPAISFESGNDLISGGTVRGEALAADYVDKRYHQPDDEYSPNWDFSGMIDDAQLLHGVGRGLATSRQWPEWSADSEFRAARDRSAGERAPSPVKRGERG